MASGSIEVESKFVAGPGTEAELVALGATLAGDASFSDRYFDTPDLRLTLADHWLRLRQGAGWELKCPPEPAGGTGGSGHGSGATARAPAAGGDGGSSHVLGATSQEPPAGGDGASGHVLEATFREPPAGGDGASGHVPEATFREPPAGGDGASGHVPEAMFREPPAGGDGASSHVPEATFREPPAGGDGASGHVPEATSRAPPAVATTYQELTSPGAIVGRLCRVLGVAPGPGWAELPAAVAGLGLEAFAAFATRRRSYRLGGGLRVDLDEADFGYAVAEVEALARAPEEVPAALEGVMRLRRALGLDGAAGAPGKMSVYLQRRRPAHYQALLRAGVLAGPPHGTAPQPPEERGPPGAGRALAPGSGGSCAAGTPSSSSAGTGLRRRDRAPPPLKPSALGGRREEIRETEAEPAPAPRPRGGVSHKPAPRRKLPRNQGERNHSWRSDAPPSRLCGTAPAPYNARAPGEDTAQPSDGSDPPVDNEYVGQEGDNGGEGAWLGGERGHRGGEFRAGFKGGLLGRPPSCKRKAVRSGSQPPPVGEGE